MIASYLCGIAIAIARLACVPHNSPMQIKSLQIGRGLATMAVLAFHLSILVTEPRFNPPPIFADYTSHGRLGVVFFFVPSAFIMTFASDPEIVVEGQRVFALVNFWCRRHLTKH